MNTLWQLDNDPLSPQEERKLEENVKEQLGFLKIVGEVLDVYIGKAGETLTNFVSEIQPNAPNRPIGQQTHYYSIINFLYCHLNRGCQIVVKKIMKEELLTNLLLKLQTFGTAMLVLVGGWLIARLASKLIERLLNALNINKLADSLNQIDMVRRADTTINVSQIVARTVYYILVLMIVALAADMLELRMISIQIENLINYFPKLFAAVLVFLGGLVIANLVKELISTSFRSLGIASGNLISNFIFYFLFITVALSALGQAEINTSFITSNLTIIIGGIVFAFAVGYGFASRKVLANMLASLYAKKKFSTGDVITVGSTTGQIVDIDTTSITLQTPDKQVIIPMARVMDEAIELHGTWDRHARID